MKKLKTAEGSSFPNSIAIRKAHRLTLRMAARDILFIRQARFHLRIMKSLRLIEYEFHKEKVKNSAEKYDTLFITVFSCILS